MADVRIPINAKHDESPANEVKSPYPFIPFTFIMITAVLQGPFIGAQAVMEMFFSRFVFVCSGSKSKSLGTIAVNVFIGLNQLTALSGGLLADYVLGNYHTQNMSNIMGTVGILLIFLSSWQYSLNKPHCCVPELNISANIPSSCHELDKHQILKSFSLSIPPDVTVVLIIIGCVLFSVGNGQTNAIQSVFVGDQFPEGESSAKEKSFSWFYLFQNVGALASECGTPFSRQSLGFVITFLVTTGSYGLATIVFMFGMSWYIRRKPANWFCSSEKNKSECEQSLLKPNLLDDHQQSVENRKQFVRICGVYLPQIVFWALFFQQNSTWVLQGAMMNCYIGKLHLPPDMMPSINDLMVIVLIPVLDYLVYPHMKKSMNVHVKPLQKIVAGMVCVAVSFLFAALLQLYITSDPIVSCRGSVSILWQIPQLLLVSFAEVFVAVTGLEFAYSQSPPQSRNLIKALWCITMALGAGLNAVIALIDLPLLYEFILYTVLMIVVVIVFVGINWNYKYKNYNH